MDAFSVDSTVWSDFIREALRISGQDPDVVSRYVRWSGGEKARTKHPIGAKYRYDARSCSIADFERDVTRILSGLCGETAGDCPWIWAEACSSPVNDVLASMRLQNCSQPEEPAAIEGEPDAIAADYCSRNACVRTGPIDLRVDDTGSAFTNKGYGRMDIAVDSLETEKGTLGQALGSTKIGYTLYKTK